MSAERGSPSRRDQELSAREPRPVRALAVVPSGPVVARLRAPASKSVTNRLLAMAALAEGDSLLHRPLDSDDTQAMRAAVGAFGARVSPAGAAAQSAAVDRVGPADMWEVQGTGGKLRAPELPIDARLSGVTMRFAAAMAALADGPVTVTGAPPLLRRPIGALSSALAALGSRVTDAGGYPPIRLSEGRLRGGSWTVDATSTTQFASALLLVAPYAEAPVTLRVTGAGATGYVDVTVEAMRAWGAAVAEISPGVAWTIAPGGYRARETDVEYDASAAAHLFALAAATGGAVTVGNAATATRQPDAGLPSVLADMGCELERAGEALTVTGPATLSPIDVDLTAMPDQVTTVAALAALAPGTSRLRGVAVTRGHETDRLAALARELRRLGVAVVEHPDGLDVTGGGARGPARLGTDGDHRLAMAFAAIAARVPGVVIEDPGCVRKTYPGFWTALADAGVRWQAL